MGTNRKIYQAQEIQDGLQTFYVYVLKNSSLTYQNIKMHKMCGIPLQTKFQKPFYSITKTRPFNNGVREEVG